ncbi:MAG: hypothetical protein Q8O36_02115 [Candidatus Omnitrophota bacterium]|nr:hypothetical protein [Candidatus Omnitrophota bacterium]
MKRISLLFLSAIVTLSLSGCYINFTALTKINDDGSGFRITTYTADGASEKDELIKNYDLPAGGSLESEKDVKDKSPDYTYEAKRLFKDLNNLAPDYVRKGAKPGYVSDNRFSLKIRKNILFATYEYEETYKDSTDERQFREFCERWYSHNLDEAVKDLTDIFPRLLEKEKIKALLNERYRPYVDYLMTAFLKKGSSLADEDNVEFKEKMDEYERRYGEEEFLPFMADYIVSRDKGVNRQEVLRKLREAYKKYEEKAGAYGERLAEDNYDDAFGVYGMSIFKSYPFNISVVMPGKIVSANSQEVSRNVAKWEFSPADFLFKEYTLRATSRKLNYVAVAILAVALMTAVILILRKIKR